MAKKKTVTRQVAKSKPAGKKKNKARARAKPAAGKAKPKAKPVSLGRPLVTAEEKLYMLFKDDYQARQLFEFLQVSSVGELEHFSPAEIVERLSGPVKQTVARVRQILAEKNRCLRGDEEFAAGQRR